MTLSRVVLRLLSVSFKDKDEADVSGTDFPKHADATEFILAWQGAGIKAGC